MLTPDDDPVPYIPTDAEPTSRPICGHADIGLQLWQLGVLHTSLDPLARLVALVVAQRADECGVISADAQPSLSDLQRETGLVMPHLYRALAALDFEGWITTGPDGFELTSPMPNRT